MVFSAEDVLGMLPEFDEEEDPSLTGPTAPEEPLMTEAEPIQSAEDILGVSDPLPTTPVPEDMQEPTPDLVDLPPEPAQSAEDILGSADSPSPQTSFQITSADDILGPQQPEGLPAPETLAQADGPINLGLDTPYTQTNIMYELYMDTLNNKDQFNMSDAEVAATEESLAAQFVADAYVDATSAMPGGRKFDEYAMKHGAPTGSRNYRSLLGKITSSLAESNFAEFMPLTDREDYAEYAVERVVQQLHEAGAPTSLLRAITKEYKKTKDDFDDLTDADVFVTAESLKNRTAQTWAQLLSIPLNALITPVAFAAAGAAGLTRGSGEPNDNLPYLQQATARDTGLYKQNVTSVGRVDAAQRIANRSYLPLPSNGSPMKLHTSDVVYIMDNLEPWQKGLRKHINKKVKELGPVPVSIHPNRQGFIDARQDPKKIYNFLKEFGAVSYYDAMETWAAPFLEGYPPIKPPPEGWVWEAASREASAKVAQKLKDAGLVRTEKPRGKVYKKGETPPFWEFLGESVGNITMGDLARSQSAQFGYAGPTTGTGPIQAAEVLLNRADNLPEEATKVNRDRLKKQIAAGAFGERLADPKSAEIAMQIIDRGAVNSSRFNSQLKEFTRNMLTMMGPEETAKATVMAIAGFKRYGIPSLIPGAEVDGIFSAQDSGLFGDDDLIPLMKTLGITDEDVKQFYEDSPGFAVAMVPGATNPLGRIAGAGVKGAGALVRAISRVSKDTEMSAAQKLRTLARATQEEYGFLDAEIATAETTRTASKDRKEKIYTPSEDEMTPVDQTTSSLRSQASEAGEMAAKTDPNDSSARTYKEVEDGLNAAADALEDAQRFEEIEMMQSGQSQSILEGVTTTLDEAAAMESPRREGAPRVSPDNPLIKRRAEEMKALIDEDNQRIADNVGKEKYKSPGQRRYREALREVAGSRNYKRVDQKFISDNVTGREHLIAKEFVRNGVTDPRVYQQLLPNRSIDGPNGIANMVLKAEQSKASQSKARFHQAMREVAELRKVPVEDVYSSTWTLGVAEDMVKNGVTDPTTYALLGITDDAVKQYVKRAEGSPSKPVVKPKQFEAPVRSEVTVKAPLTVGRVVADAPYGVTRAVLGKKPANILSNRLNKVNGRGAKGALPMLEASMLATAEFMKSPFAILNFPAWMGEFSQYMYMNSTGKGPAQRFIRSFFNYTISPSKKLGSKVYNWMTHSEGRKVVSGFEMEALGRMFDSESDISAMEVIDGAMEAVALDQHTPGQLSRRLVPENTLSQEQKNNLAIALMNMRDGGYVELPANAPNGSKQKVLMNDLFTMEYKKDGVWVDAFAAKDTMADLKSQKKGLSDERKAKNKRQKEIRAEQIKNKGEALDPALAQELAAIKAEKKEIAQQISEIDGQIEGIQKEFGTAKDVFQVVDGKITGVQDIRFNFKDSYEGPVGDTEKTLLGMANGYVRPMQMRIMEMGANLAVGETSLRLSIESGKAKNAVSILNTKTGEREHIKTFTGPLEDAIKRAGELAKSINEKMAKKGNEFEVAEAVSADMATGRTKIVGKRDLEVNGYDAVANTAGYMSAYFTETAFLDFIHDNVKKFHSGELSGGQYAKQNQVAADMLVALYPKKEIQRLRKKHGKKGENLSNTQLAVLITRGLEDGSIAKISAKGSGRFVKERLWAKALEFDQRKDFYALYTYATETAHNQLIKRNEYYRMLTMLRDEGLILTKNEIDSTPGLSTQSNQFILISDLQKKYPGLIDDLDGAYIASDVADGLIQQQNLVNAVTRYGNVGTANLKGDSFLSTANRQLKRGAVVSGLNGTMARNFTGGIAVQAQMADVPATMRYAWAAAKANRAIRDGVPPSDPLFRQLSEMMGGPGRSIIELGARGKQVKVSAAKTKQAEYIFSMLSGDGDAPPLGEALQKATSKGQKDVAVGVAKVIDPERKASRDFGGAIGLVEDPAAVPPQNVRGEVGKAQKVKAAASAFSEQATTAYGSIDDVVRLAYAYEMVKRKGMSPSDAAAAARKVFYDYPDIPPLAQMLRDAPIVGIPFIGYQLWSTKAMGRYYEKNPMKAAILGAYLNAMSEATERTLKLSSMYDADLFDGTSVQDIKSEFPLPIMTSARTTEAERARLIAAGVPPEEAKFKISQQKLDQGPLSVGIQTDVNLQAPAILASQNNDISFTEMAVLAGGAQRGMVGNLLESAFGGAKGEQRQEDRIAEEMALNTSPKEGGGFSDGLDVIAEAVEGTIETIGMGISDVRAFAKFVSASSGKPYAGQDKTATDTLSNFLGLATRATDPRLVTKNFNDIGQKKIKKINAALEALRRAPQTTINARGRSWYLAKEQLLRQALYDFEGADNIFKQGRKRDGLEFQNNIRVLLNSVLKYDPTNPQVKDSYLDLMNYLGLEEEDISTKVLEK